MSMQDQPPPKKNDGTQIWDLVIRDMKEIGRVGPVRDLVLADMSERDRVGRERYGTPLQANNGRDYLIDAYQEAMDLCAYLRQGVEEGSDARSIYIESLLMLIRLRKRMLARDGK